MPLYCAAVLEEIQKPDIAIVHVGTNDIRGREIADIREDFVNLHTYMQEQDISMIISLLTCRADEHEDKVRQINHMLIELSDQLDIGYSGNENIKQSHLNRGGLHLKNEGSDILASNISDTILQIC
jgi:lysophospholipase L1-like esterase